MGSYGKSEPRDRRNLTSSSLIGRAVKSDAEDRSQDDRWEEVPNGVSEIKSLNSVTSVN